jgi:exonuclease VII small subunit
MEELATLSEHPDPWNRQWLASMQRQLNEIASINNEVLTYPSPPAQYAEAHAVLRQAATELENTAHSFSRGVETFDPFLIMQAVERLDSNIERLQEALNTLEDAANP